MVDRIGRLLKLKSRLKEQIIDAECLLEALDDYCQENPDDAPCAANDPGWREQIMRQRSELLAQLMAVEERLGRRKSSHSRSPDSQPMVAQRPNRRRAATRHTGGMSA
jgi:hypothetical protein